MRYFALIILLSPVTLFCQSLKQRQIVEQSFVVLKNDNNVLPYKNLETKNFYLLFNNKKADIFYKSLSRYDNFRKNKHNANAFIVALSKNSDKKIKKYKNLLKGKSFVLCLFNTLPEDNFLCNNAEAIIYTPFNDSLTIDYCGQLLFGAFSVNNILITDLGAYKKGSGLNLQGGIRFKYTIPQEIGLDSLYIFSKIDSIAKFAIRENATPGCQIFAAVDKKVFINKSYGYHTYDSLKTVSNTDLYDLASITKISATAPAMMLLSENEIIDINKRISKYLWRLKFSDKRKITFVDAFCHQAKLKPWIPFWKNALNKKKELSSRYFNSDSSWKYPTKVIDSLFLRRKYKRKIIKQIKKSPLREEKKYKYSDLSFYFYPEIVNKYTKKGFEEFLRNNFYSKLGANSLCFNPLHSYSRKKIVPTEKDIFFRKILIHGYVHDEGAALLGGVSGHAGLFGTANDLAKLMQMYLNYGVYGNQKYIDSLILKKWTSYQFKENGNRRGIIFDKPLLVKKSRGTPSPKASKESFGHSGFTGTFTWADPKYDFLFVFLSNRVYPSRSNKKLLSFNIRTNIHTILYNAIIQKEE